MLKELGLVFSCVSLLGSGQPQRNYSHTEDLNAQTSVTYKYESNEVNGVDDLIVGNVYKISAITYTNAFTLCNATMVSFTQNNGTSLEIIRSDNLRLRYSTYIYVQYLDENDSWVNISVISPDTDYVLQYNGNVNASYISNFSYTDYNVIEDVTYTPPTTFIGVINEFCQNYIFSEIPLVNEITFTVGGQQISLMTYIVIFVGLVCGVGLLILFIMLLKWLFLLFSGAFHLRK